MKGRSVSFTLGTAILCAGLGAGALLMSPAGAQAEKAPLHVAAAADLMPVLPTLVRNFTKKTGIPVRISWGASGEEAQAIRHRAPYDLFLSADRSFPERLAAGGYLRKESLRTYAKGILVLWISKATLDRAHEQPGVGLLSRGFIRRIALANPRLAPYGLAAVACLRSKKLWPALRRKAVYGNSLAQVAQYLRTGAAQAGFLSESQSRVLERSVKGHSVSLSPSCAPYLSQEMGIVTRSGNQREARAFEDYLLGASAQRYLMKHGYH
ncbi:MAG: molybdate ABC transporter substrate-binding protein [Nitrospiraceae bacterium]|nr:molybdate ABC transporter substrate-binding protein [Nitrospiraceae bacterium]